MLLELSDLMFQRFLTGFGTLVFFSKSYEIFGEVFNLVSSLHCSPRDSFSFNLLTFFCEKHYLRCLARFWMRLWSFRKPMAQLLDQRIFCYYVNDLPVDAIVNVVIPWPTIFTRPNITHYEEKNSRPDFQKIICVKVK